MSLTDFATSLLTSMVVVSPPFNLLRSLGLLSASQRFLLRPFQPIFLVIPRSWSSGSAGLRISELHLGGISCVSPINSLWVTTQRAKHFLSQKLCLRAPSLSFEKCRQSVPNPALKFAPCGRWDAPSARPLATRYVFKPRKGEVGWLSR